MSCAAEMSPSGREVTSGLDSRDLLGQLGRRLLAER